MGELAAAEADAATKAQTKADVTARTAHEIDGFNQVLDLLDDVVVRDEFVQTGRNLLDAANADPDAIDRVKGKIQDLIDASNVESQAAVDADDAESFLASESVRISDEAAALSDVRDLLST